MTLRSSLLQLAPRAALVLWLAACGRTGAGSADRPGDAVPTMLPESGSDVARPARPTGDAEADDDGEPAAADTARAADGGPAEVEAGAVAAPEFRPCGTPPDGMACVPGGPFWRGADDGEPDERPRHRATVSTFYIDVYEVTAGEFQRCVAAGACRRPMPYREFKAARQPVVATDWFNARDYCAWVGKRLPTEAEWEKAARGPDGALYPWGDEAPTCARAQYDGCRPATTVPVGSFAAGAYGLFDMAGNSWEWVADWHSGCYSGGADACGADCAGLDPRGPCGGAEVCPGRRFRVLKGGSWYWPAERLRASERRPMQPDSGVHRLGFRCALDADGAARPAPAAPGSPATVPAGRVDRGAPDAAVAPLEPGQRETLAAAPEEELERPLADPRHYVRSNERRLDAWFPHIDGLGGGYFGIGADQNYTLLARARSDFAWLMDYDAVVVQVHRVYRALVLASADPEQFVARWDADRRDEVLALLDAAYPGDPELPELKLVYRRTQPLLAIYFHECLARRRERYPTGWLSDPATYRYVRAMMAEGRIRFLRGDLLGPTTVRGIGETARRLGVPLRVVYLSNAEEWFHYTAAFRESFSALPGDGSSVVLRTSERFELAPADGKWNYQVQALADFVARLADPAVTGLADFVRAAEVDDGQGTSRLGVRVPE